MNFLGIDLGTSSVKIIIMDEKGKAIASTTKNYPVSYPKEGYAEQKPEDWWDSTKEGIQELLKTDSIKADDIKGISFSGQMHGLVILDQNNEVLRPAILWCDQRTQKQCDYLNNVFGQENLSKLTGNKALTGFTIPKILWVKENEPDIFKKIAHVMLPKDYISFKLTGKYSSDVSDASGTLMFDVENRQWSKQMIELVELDAKAFPTVYESFEVVSELAEEVAKELGLEKETLVIAGAGDQAAGAVGTGTVEKGVLSVALGTSGVVFACNDMFSVDKDNTLHSFCHSNGKWHQMGVMLSAAACLQWWVDNIVQDSDKDIFDKLLAEAEQSLPGSNKLFFLPYLMGERTPYSDPNARGSFVGLSITHNRGDMTRAILEGVCYGLRDSLELIKAQGIEVQEVRVSGGGSKSKLWRQILSDIFNVKVSVINSKEGPAYGAAILAAVGCGIYKDVDEACRSIISVTDTTEPIFDNVDIYERYYTIYRSLYPSLKNTFEVISSL